MTPNKEQTKHTLAIYARNSSHDPDTQTACAITSPSGHFIQMAANRLPDGVKWTVERTSRPAKYTYIEHAERLAIALAARRGLCLRDCTMWLNWFPCADCARAIVNAGFAVLVADREKYEVRKDDPRYGFADAMTILTEAGVRVEWF